MLYYRVPRLRWHQVGVAFAGFCTALLTLFGLSYFVNVSGQSAMSDYQTYFDTEPSFEELDYFFTQLAEKEGAPYAFSVLIDAQLPPTIDTHLLGHFVGNILYRQEGIDGLRFCTPDIGFACAHSIVISALLDRGDVVFDEINDICEKVQGGNGYNMCFHGFGHGVLAYAAYELPEALTACERVGTEKHAYNEVAECVGGVIMEMRGGIHNPVVWEKNGRKYLDSDNPIAMCESTYMSDKVRDMCFIYLTPFLFDAVSQDDIPRFSAYAPALALCERVEMDHRPACYAGFAKEFLGFELGRDIRLVEVMTDEQLMRIQLACAEAPTADGEKECLRYAVYNLYRSGNHPFDVAVRYCSLVKDAYSADACWKLLDEQVTEHEQSESRETFCADAFERAQYVCAPVDPYVSQNI